MEMSEEALVHLREAVKLKPELARRLPELGIELPGG
jgi:hypothetical protein